MAAVDAQDVADVRENLTSRPATVALLLDMRAEVRRRFGEESGIKLVSGYDVRGDGFYGVSVFARLGKKSDEKRESFRLFRREWWYSRVGRPEYGIALRTSWQ